jgi:hypothetical protein
MPRRDTRQRQQVRGNMLQKLGEQLKNKPTVGSGARRRVGHRYRLRGRYRLLAARLGFALLTDPERVAVFWPAAGVAAGTLVALGRWARAPVAVAVKPNASHREWVRGPRDR